MRLSAGIAVLALVVGVRSSAQVTWKRTYGGADADRAASVRATPDGGAVICGSTGSFGNSGDAYLIKVDLYGAIEWSRVMGGPSVDIGSMALPLNDGGYVVAGTTQVPGAGGYEGYLTRLDASGETLWERTYGTSEWDFFHALDTLADGFVIAGASYGTGNGSGDLWVVRTDAEGHEIWSRAYDSSGQDEGRSVRATADGGCVVAGSSGLDGADANALIVRYGPDGTELWHGESGGSGPDVGYSVDALADGGFVLVGYTRSYASRSQMFMARYDAAGSEVWSRAITSSGNDWEARSVRERPDGSFAVAGYTKEYGAGGRDVSLLFTDPEGNFISGPTYGGTDDDEAWSMDLGADGSYFLAGSTKSFGPGIEAMFVIRSDGDTLNGAVVTVFDPVPVPDRSMQNRSTAHPNPVEGGATLFIAYPFRPQDSVEFVDAQGRTAATVRPEGMRVVVPFLSPGVYGYRFTDVRGVIANGRVIIE